MPVVLGAVGGGGLRVLDAGVVEEAVEPAELALGGRDRALDVRGDRDVGAREFGRAALLLDLARDRLTLLLVVREQHRGAVARERLRGGAADAGRSPRHDRDLAVEPSHVASPPSPARAGAVGCWCAEQLAVRLHGSQGGRSRRGGDLRETQAGRRPTGAAPLEPLDARRKA